MIDKPHITKVAAQSAAVIRITIPKSEIRNVMGPGIQELFATLAAQGIKPAGAWYTYHHRMDPGIYDLDIGIPITVPIKPAGRVIPGQLPAATVAKTVFHGDYEGLFGAWDEFDTWVKTEGHKPAANMWECYTVGPETDPNPAAWRTELYRPLKIN
ncbi:MAG: GyrI-like domain-containing protein [Planctomycetes bacterium]|nr:GyrI-like domain-containing protein [Planctomycetota bacterium]